jgi:hypothetical protein
VKKFIAAGLFLLGLSACSIPPPAAVTSAPTLARELTSTAVPTGISSSPTAAADVTAELTPVDPSTTEWYGIPIMPGAMTGEGDAEGYVFTIQASSQQVQAYYEEELGKLGWQAAGRTDEESSLTLTFVNSAAELLSITIIAREDQALVLLVK